jgi:hypothetical protein
MCDGRWNVNSEDFTSTLGYSGGGPPRNMTEVELLSEDKYTSKFWPGRSSGV